jgi:hypothetical protein
MVQNPNVYSSRLLNITPNPDFTICEQAKENVEEWPRLGHIISVHSEDEHDIINRRNRMCGQINNVSCFFDKRDPFVKIRLLTSYTVTVCTIDSSPIAIYYIYISIVCTEASCGTCLIRASIVYMLFVAERCAYRALNLPADESSKLLPGLCGTIPVL